MIDLRSDTVTQPSLAMKNAMIESKLGDDVLEDDPTVKELEAYAASLFGHEAGLFCPSGTMTNQIAIKVQSNAPGEVICSDLAHIYHYEGGGIGFNSGLSTKLISGNRGRFSAKQLEEVIAPNDVHFAPSQLVSIENTCNKGGGSCWENSEIEAIATLCHSKRIPLHLDGARLFNALVAKNQKAESLGKHFNSISICLSKGLGAPVGSVLIGNHRFITQAKRIRKVLGGGMRQSGLLAAAGLYALKNNINRLAEDHKNAKEIADVLASKNYIKGIEEVETNIVLATLNDDYPSEEFIYTLKKNDIHVVGMGKQKVRFVTHLDFSSQQLEEFIKRLP